LSKVKQLLERKTFQKQIITTRMGFSLEEAAIDMVDHAVGCLLVMDHFSDSPNKLVGIITEKDIIRAVSDGVNVEETAVSAYMTRNVISVSPDTLTLDCLELMRKLNIRHLPVIDNNIPVGVVSMRDVFDVVVNEQSQVAAAFESYILGKS
jgi:CBS domain-containing protein